MGLTPEERVANIFAEAVGRDLSSWEKYEFLPSIRMRVSLSAKQEEVLSKIEQRVFEGEEE